METLPEFIACLSPSQRLSYIDQFSQAWASHDEAWRRRQQKALQIGRMASLFPPETFNHHYLNLFLTSIDDPVAEVRNSAAKSFS
jgi:hypothetical protein